MTTVTFDSLGLAEPLLRALKAAGHVTPTPIQAQGIPPVVAGRDLLGLAETGSGKTAAFVLPILNRLASVPPSPRRHPRALILTPTRELAVQIAETVGLYSRHLPLRTAVIFGGVSAHRQIQECRQGIDIVVATPGRLLDLMNQRALSLHEVEVLVLDEADRMLDMGFIRDVRRITATLPQKRQALLFSATMPKEVSELAAGLLTQPVRVDLAPKSVTVDRITQQVIHIDVRRKRALLAGLLCAPQLERVIVFTRTKHGANKVARQLTEIGIKADAIHGNKSQNARQDALESFRAGRVRVLVATDIAARGIDVREISHVINYELPKDAESYVHRIGRTARAGAEGAAISFCAPEERGELRDIERLLRRPVPPMEAGPWLQLSQNIPAIMAGDSAPSHTTPHAPQREQRHRGRPPRRAQRRRAA